MLDVAIALIEGHEIQDLGTEEAEPPTTMEKTRPEKYGQQGKLSQNFKKHKLVPIVMSGKKKKISSLEM